MKLWQLVLVGFFWCVKDVLGAPLMTTPMTSKYLDVELPFRCLASSDVDENVSSIIVLSKNDFTVKLPAQTDLLPRFQVNGFSFRNKRVDVAISQLVKDAGIIVEAEEGSYLTLSASNLKGELTSVLEQLVRQGHLFYVYHADTKKLFLTHRANAVIQLPPERAIVMTVSDALNGGHFEPTSIDWSNFQISLSVTRPELEQIRALMANLIKERYLLSIQMKLYAITPLNTNSHWQNVLSSFGPRQFSSMERGVVGHALVLRQSTNEKAFLKSVQQSFNSVLLGGGTAVVPSGWKTRFNLNQCTFPTEYKDLSILFKSSIRRKDKAQTILTLDSSAGEIATFNINNALDQRIVVVGIPVPNHPEQEFMMTLQTNFIQLLREGEKND